MKKKKSSMPICAIRLGIDDIVKIGNISNLFIDFQITIFQNSIKKLMSEVSDSKSEQSEYNICDISAIFKRVKLKQEDQILQGSNMGTFFSNKHNFSQLNVEPPLEKDETKNCIKDSQNTSSRIFLKTFGLRKVVQEQKTKMLTKNFQKKMMRNIKSSKPVVFQPYKNDSEDGNSFLQLQGFQIPWIAEIIYCIFTLFSIVILCFINTVAIIFPEISKNEGIKAFQIVGMILFATEIILSLFTVKILHGRKLTQLKKIIPNYLRGKFLIDLLCFLLILLEYIFGMNGSEENFLKLLIFLKTKEFFSKVSKVENAFVYSFERERYVSVAKIFAINFVFAHILAVLLISMAGFEQGRNWLQKAEIQHQPWFEQYAWAYYWGTTTMLTVGFGDISPANYKEALCLTIIEAFSCILLAYNINCVGNIISNIHNQNIEKDNNLKTIRRLTEQNNLSEEIERKVCNYINEEDRMKKKFKFLNDKEFISSLPLELKTEFIKESNSKTFRNLRFFRNLTEKTLLSLAEKIQVKIAHPEQIIFKPKDDMKFLILKEGTVGFCTKIPTSVFNQTIVDKVTVQKGKTPELLHLLFFTQQKIPKFEIKSLSYIMLSSIEIEEAKAILKPSAYDFEYFCQQRDGSKHIIDEFEIINCEFCPTKHSKLDCPKLHYIPLKQMVVFKHLHSVKTSRNDRKFIQRKGLNPNVQSAVKTRKLSKKLQKLIYGKSREQKKRKSSIYRQSLVSHLLTQNPQREEKLNVVQKIDNNQFCPNEILNEIQKKINFLIVNQNDELSLFSEINVDEAHNYKFYFQDNNSKMHKDTLLGKPLNSQPEILKHSEITKFTTKLMHKIFPQTFQNKQNPTVFADDNNSLFQQIKQKEPHNAFFMEESPIDSL